MYVLLPIVAIEGVNTPLELTPEPVQVPPVGFADNDKVEAFEHIACTAVIVGCVAVFTTMAIVFDDGHNDAVGLELVV